MIFNIIKDLPINNEKSYNNSLDKIYIVEDFMTMENDVKLIDMSNKNKEKVDFVEMNLKQHDKINFLTFLLKNKDMIPFNVLSENVDSLTSNALFFDNLEVADSNELYYNNQLLWEQYYKINYEKVRKNIVNSTKFIKINNVKLSLAAYTKYLLIIEFCKSYKISSNFIKDITFSLINSQTKNKNIKNMRIIHQELLCNILKFKQFPKNLIEEYLNSNIITNETKEILKNTQLRYNY